MGNFDRGWAEAAGKAAGEAERAEREAPIAPGKPYFPLLPGPTQQQFDSQDRARRRFLKSKALDRKLDQVLGTVDE